MEPVWGEGSEEFQNVWNFTCDFLEQRDLNIGSGCPQNKYGRRACLTLSFMTTES